jgi:signal-transduction protein with cAMP-binding, CBS, and nucleotidyltransferase domain
MNDIREYMAESLLSVENSSNLLDAANYMHENKIHALLVEEGGEYIGIVTDDDFSWKVISAQLDPKETKVSQVMNLPLISVDIETGMKSASEIMLEKNVRHLAVTEMGKIAGILSIKDFSRYFISQSK